MPTKPSAASRPPYAHFRQQRESCGTGRRPGTSTSEYSQRPIRQRAEFRFRMERSRGFRNSADESWSRSMALDGPTPMCKSPNYQKTQDARRGGRADATQRIAPCHSPPKPRRRHAAAFFSIHVIWSRLQSAAAGSPAAAGAALENAHVLCLPALRSFGHAEFNRLAFLQAAVSARLNRGEVHKDVFPSLTRDKSKAFIGIEPLNCSLFHFCFSYSDLTQE